MKTSKKQFWISASIIVFIGLIISSLYYYGIRVNFTSSMPIGVYRLIPGSVKRGDTIIANFKGIPKYVDKTGTAILFTENVVKKVIAVPGDDVVLTAQEVIVNGRRYASPIQETGSNGLKLIHVVKPGKFQNISGYWLYGSNNKQYSWDSRYFGPVDKNRIIGRCKPMLIG